jgi:O-antigen ligase
MGIVGVGLFLIFFLGAWWKSIGEVARSASIESDFAVVFLVLIFIHGASDLTVSAINNIYWILLVTVVLWQPASADASSRRVAHEAMRSEYHQQECSS